MQTSDAILMHLAMLPPRARAAVLAKIVDPAQRDAVERRLAAVPKPHTMTLGDARRIAASNPGGITIHRRPTRGSIPCWGKCGRRISANKALCLSCQRLQDRSNVDDVT